MLKERLISFWTAVSAVILYELSPNIRAAINSVWSWIQDIIGWTEVVKKALDLAREHELSLIIIWWTVYVTAESVIWLLNYYRGQKKFEKKEYDSIINVSIMYFDSGTLNIESEVEVHLDDILGNEPFMNKKILDASKEVRSPGIVVKFPNEEIAWDVYKRLRSLPWIFWDRIDSTYRAKEALMWTKKEDITFVWVLTKEPQYTFTEDWWVKETKKSESPNTKSQIRLSVFPLVEIESAIRYINEKAENEWIDFDVYVDSMNTDNMRGKQLLKEFIIHMLDIDYYDWALPLKHKGYVRKLITLTRVAQEYHNGNPHLKIWI